MADLAQELVDGDNSIDEAVPHSSKNRNPSSGTTYSFCRCHLERCGSVPEGSQALQLHRALNYLANPGDQSARRQASSRSRWATLRLSSTAFLNGIVVPNEVLRRDLNVGTATAGGNLVDDVLLSGGFIELLRNRLALANAGMTTLSGINGNISIPKQGSSATAYWVGEGASPTESQQTIEQVNLSPKTCGAFVDYSRKLLLQSSIDVEAMVRDDLARVIALELDRVGLNGSGSSNQPLGIINTTGIGTQSLTSFGTFEEYIGMETDVAAANADAGSLRYIINASARGAQKAPRKMLVVVSSSSTTTRSTATVTVSTSWVPTMHCSATSMLIMAMWSGLDLTVDPYAGATAGTVRIIALQMLTLLLSSLAPSAAPPDTGDCLHRSD